MPGDNHEYQRFQKLAVEQFSPLEDNKPVHILDRNQGRDRIVGMRSHMALWAFRYALGRMTYCPSMVQEELRRIWPELSEEDRYCVVRDLGEEIERDCKGLSSLGMDCDRKGWREFYEWAMEANKKLGEAGEK